LVKQLSVAAIALDGPVGDAARHGLIFGLDWSRVCSLDRRFVSAWRCLFDKSLTSSPFRGPSQRLVGGSQYSIHHFLGRDARGVRSLPDPKLRGAISHSTFSLLSLRNFPALNALWKSRNFLDITNEAAGDRCNRNVDLSL
jgi:hypothetical protein